MNRVLLIISFLIVMPSVAKAQDYMNILIDDPGVFDSGRQIHVIGSSMYMFSDYISEDGVYGVKFRKLTDEGEIEVDYHFHEPIETGSGTLTNVADGLVESSDSTLVFTLTNNSESWFIRMDYDLNILDSALLEHPTNEDERFSSVSLKSTLNGLVGLAYTEGEGYSQASIFKLEEDFSISAFFPNVVYQYNVWIRDFKVLSDGNFLLSGRLHVPTEDTNFAFGTRLEAFMAKIDAETGEQLWLHSYGYEGVGFSDMGGAELPNGNVLSFVPWTTAQNGPDEEGLWQDYKSYMISPDGEIIDSTDYFSAFKGQVLDVRYNDGKVYCHGYRVGSNNNTREGYFLITDTLGNQINESAHFYSDCWGCRNESFHMDFKENGNIVGFGHLMLIPVEDPENWASAWLYEADCQGRTVSPTSFIENVEVGLSLDLTELTVQSDSLLWLEELDWYIDDELLTSYEYDFSAEGEFYLGQEVIVQGRYCNQSFQIETELTEAHVGISEILQDVNTVSIFPNPAQDFIELSSNEKIRKINITDVNGKVVLQKAINQKQAGLNIENLANGIYLMKVVTESGEEVHKLISRSLR